MKIYKTNQKGKYLESRYRKKVDYQATFSEIAYFLKRVLEWKYNKTYPKTLPRRTVYTVLEQLRDKKLIENIEPHRGIWAITPLGSEFIKARTAWVALKKYMDMGSIPNQLVAFERTLEPESKLVAIDIVTRIKEPEIVSRLYVMRKQAKDDSEFAKRIAEMISLTLKMTSKLASNPEFAKMVKDAFQEGETIRNMAKLIEVFQKT